MPDFAKNVLASITANIILWIAVAIGGAVLSLLVFVVRGLNLQQSLVIGGLFGVLLVSLGAIAASNSAYRRRLDPQQQKSDPAATYTRDISFQNRMTVYDPSWTTSQRQLADRAANDFRNLGFPYKIAMLLLFKAGTRMRVSNLQDALTKHGFANAQEITNQLEQVDLLIQRNEGVISFSANQLVFVTLEHILAQVPFWLWS